MTKYYIVREIRSSILYDGEVTTHERYLGAFASLSKAKGLRNSSERDRFKSLVSDYIDSFKDDINRDIRDIQESVVKNAFDSLYGLTMRKCKGEIEVAAEYALRCPITYDEYAYDITYLNVDTDKEEN